MVVLRLNNPQYQYKCFYPFPKQALVFTCLKYKPFGDNVEKGQIAYNEQFLLFPQCFLKGSENLLPFSSDLKLSSENFFSLKTVKVVASNASSATWNTISCKLINKDLY